MARSSGGSGPVSKDFVAVRVNVTAGQLDQVLSALSIAKKEQAIFKPGQIYILQKKSRKPTKSKRG